MTPLLFKLFGGIGLFLLGMVLLPDGLRDPQDGVSESSRTRQAHALDRIGYHTWRASHYIAGNGTRFADAEPSEANPDS